MNSYHNNKRMGDTKHDNKSCGTRSGEVARPERTANWPGAGHNSTARYSPSHGAKKCKQSAKSEGI